MNSDGYHKYFLILRFDIPMDISNYIMIKFYKLPTTKIFASRDHTLIIKNNILYGYGELYKKQLPEIDPINIKKVVHGYSFSLILNHDGNVYMYGGINDPFAIPVYNQSSDLQYIMNNIRDVFAHSFYCVYITNDNELYLQGSFVPASPTTSGEFQYFKAITPVETTLINVNMVHCEIKQILVLLNNGIVCNTASGNMDLPHLKELFGRDEHYLGVTLDDKIYTWGNDMVKHNDIKISRNDIKMISCTDCNTFILTKNGNLYSYGNGSYGKLGIIDSILDWIHNISIKTNDEPKLIKIDLPPIYSIHCGANHVMVLTEKDDIYSWGSNQSNQLGPNIKDGHQRTPIKIIL